jgi:hypothetical protein
LERHYGFRDLLRHLGWFGLHHDLHLLLSSPAVFMYGSQINRPSINPGWAFIGTLLRLDRSFLDLMSLAKARHIAESCISAIGSAVVASDALALPEVGDRQFHLDIQ